MSKVLKLLGLLFITLGLMKPGHSDEPTMKVLYSKDSMLPGYAASTTEGARMGESKEGIAFTIDVWQEGKDLWPRMWILGPGVDISAYTKLVAEIENPTDNTQNIVMSARETPDDNAGQAWLLPPRSTTEVIMDISDGAPLNQSNIKEFNFYVYHPTTLNHYILKKLTAVRNPDFVSKKTALGNQLDEAQRDYDRLKTSSTAANSTGTGSSRVNEIGALLASARAEYETAPLGYASSVQKKLIELQQNIARTGMDSRGSDLWLWTSSLGTAIRKGTLPSPADAALQRISERICLNQYKAICLNLSAAANARKVKVQFKAPGAPQGLFSLRPTLNVIARDGSETADAIGEGVAELEMTVESYQSQQVLLWVNTKLPGLRPGNYKASLEVSIDGTVWQKLPVDIEIANLKLASGTPLNVHNWAYFYIGNTPHTTGLEKEAMANLRDYGINTWSQDYTQIPLPKLTAAGKYDGLDARAVEQYGKILELQQGRPEEAQIIWLGLQRANVKELLARPGVLRPYLRDMSALLDKYKVPKDKRYIQFWDEPRLPEVRESMEWMRKIRAIDPTFKFYDNSSFPPPDDAELKEYVKLVDRWLPNWDNLFNAKPEDSERVQAAGVKHLGFYRCLVSRNNRGVNIYEYYRLMGWYLMPRGWDTLAFWVYNVGPEGWDGTQGSVSGGTVVFQKDGKLLSSRRWELFREGLDDYKLAQLAIGSRGAIDARRHPELLKICNEVEKNAHDTGYADQMRLKLIDLALKKKAKAGS